MLWFATIPSVERLIRAAIADEHDLDTVVLDLAGVGRMDFSAAAALRRIVEEIGDYENDVTVEIVNVRQARPEAPPPISSTDASAARYQVIGWVAPSASAFGADALGGHLRADLLPQFRQPVVHNPREEVVQCVVVVAPDDQA